MIVPESIGTPRLRLRKPRPEDAEAIFTTYAQDPEVTRYLLFQPHRDVAETHAVIERFLNVWQSQTEFVWLIFSASTNELVGSISARKDSHGVNIGYLLARKWWGQGLMAEAICAVTDWAFTEPWVLRAWAVCDCENIGSARAMEKAGFRREWMLPRYGVHPNISSEPRDCYLYAKTRGTER